MPRGGIMADRKEVNILLLGIVAILAIVGLVILFTSPAATGRAYTLPPIPEVAVPAGENVFIGGGLPGTPVFYTYESCAAVSCPGGCYGTQLQRGIYKDGGYIQTCICPGLEATTGVGWARQY